MNELKNLINEMIEFYRENDCFEPWQLNQILNLVEFHNDTIGKLIYKFYIINTTIASNGGVPVLKEILSTLSNNKEVTI